MMKKLKLQLPLSTLIKKKFQKLFPVYLTNQIMDRLKDYYLDVQKQEQKLEFVPESETCIQQDDIIVDFINSIIIQSFS